MTDRLRADGAAPHLTVTTTSGFASLWLIPRLRGFTAVHPDVDVRISASYKLVALERSLVDVAVRLCRTEEAPEGAIRLFGEELFPICSPALVAEGPHPLRAPQDLEHHALLHMDGAGGYFDWSTWLAARGLRRPQAGGLAQVRRLRADDQRRAERPGRGHGHRPPRAGSRGGGPAGRAVRQERGRPRAYYVVRSQLTGTRPHVQAFVDWLVAEAQGRHASPMPAAAALSSRPPAAKSAGAARRARSRP